MGTLGSIRDYTSWKWNSDAMEYVPELTTDLSFINGDMTVPLLSATWDGAAGEHTYYTTVKHSSMFKNNGIIEQIVNILNGNPDQLGTGITKQKSQLTGYSVTINSPVSLGIRTQNGYVGPDSNGELVSEDDSVNYSVIDHNKFAFVPGNAPFDILLKGEGEGTFSLTINRNENGIVTKSAKFMDVPVSIGDLVNISASETLESSLNIDKLGNGSIDNVVTPKLLTQQEAKDTIKPLLTYDIQGIQGKNNWYRSDVKVTLTSSDEGSGVEKINYNLDKHNGLYTNPIVISGDGPHKLWAVAKDKNDNYSEPIYPDINIDTTSPSVTCDVAGFYPLQGSFTVNYNTFDSMSGIDTVNVQLNGVEVTKGQSISLTKLGTNEITITATDIAGNSTTLTKKFEVYLPVDLSINPQIINLRALGVITASVSLPTGYPTLPLDGTVEINGVYAKKHVSNTPNKLIYQFNRDELSSFIPKGTKIPVTITGFTGSYYIKGITNINVE